MDLNFPFQLRIASLVGDLSLEDLFDCKDLLGGLADHTVDLSELTLTYLFVELKVIASKDWSYSNLCFSHPV